VREADIAKAASQPGRIGSGTVIRARTSAASTAFAPTGRSTPAPMLRVAISTDSTSSARPPDEGVAFVSAEVPLEVSLYRFRVAREPVGEIKPESWHDSDCVPKTSAARVRLV